MRRPSQVIRAGLCLVLLALSTLACREEPAGSEPASSLPLWARCENWRRSDQSCDPSALLADHQDCVRTDGFPPREARSRIARQRAQERAVIVCLERRGWRMNASALQNLPGRPQPAGPPS